MDHIDPVVNPETGFTTFDDYIERMFCGVAGFQVLCKSCHDAKTYLENQLRYDIKENKCDFCMSPCNKEWCSTKDEE